MSQRLDIEILLQMAISGAGVEISRPQKMLLFLEKHVVNIFEKQKRDVQHFSGRVYPLVSVCFDLSRLCWPEEEGQRHPN